MIESSTLIYDIETKTFGRPDSSKDMLKVFGCFSYKTGKYYMLTDKQQIQKIINAHKYLVGFNNEGTQFEPGYDNPILKREGINMKYKLFIDLRAVIKNRASQMMIKKGMLGDLIMEYSLDYITKLLDLVNDETGKGELDYSILKKDSWTKEEIDKIYEYTKRDIEITKKLYEWVEEYFDSFKHFLNEEDVRKKVYINASIAKFAYKAICKAMKWQENYGDITGDDEKIGGGYVAYPAGEKFEGNIYCLDFNSLYPHIMIQCNLYGRKKPGTIDERPIWTGNNTWKVEGIYYADKMNGVCKLLSDWYEDRVQFKKDKDKREYTIKIILNAIYGILNNPYYNKVYDRVAGGDCTRIGRQWIKYARKVFKKYDYEVCYTDTDSVYVIDKFNDEKKLLLVVKEIIDYIKSTVPFPQDTFDMGIDDRIKYMFFFKGQNNEDKDTDIEMDDDDFINKPKGLMKKNYLYVKTDDKVVIKNLGIKKKSNSALSKKIFWDYLVPEIKKGQILFSKVYLRNLIMELLEKDIKLASMRKEVGKFSQYETKSPNSLPGQIARKYGSGIHFMIPNTKNIGVGKGKSFCALEEFKNNKLKVDDIDLTNVWKELDYFVKPVVVKNIFDF